MCRLYGKFASYFSSYKWSYCPGGTPFNGLYRVASHDRGTFFRLRLYEKRGISLADDYKRIIFDLLKDPKGLTAETIKLL